MSCLTKHQAKDKIIKPVEAPPEALQKRLAKDPLPVSLTQQPVRRGVLGPEDQKIQHITNHQTPEQVDKKLMNCSLLSLPRWSWR